MPRKSRFHTEDDVFFCKFSYCKYSTTSLQDLKRHKTQSRHDVKHLATQQQGPSPAGSHGDLRSDADAQMGVGQEASDPDIHPHDVDMDIGDPLQDVDDMANDPAEG